MPRAWLTDHEIIMLELMAGAMEAEAATDRRVMAGREKRKRVAFLRRLLGRFQNAESKAKTAGAAKVRAVPTGRR